MRLLPRRRRARVALGVVSALVVIVGGFAVVWVSTDAHEVSLATADQQFRHHSHTKAGYKKPGRPAVGVYAYVGSGTASLSLPPKTEHAGPTMPGTVTYGAGGCWTLRIDYSDVHWEFATYCPHGDALWESSRGGYYDWDFVATSISDTSTYTCRPAEVAIPGPNHRDRPYRFSCRGKNHPLKLGPVTLAGTVRYLGSGVIDVGGVSVPALHLEEVARFSGAQSGTDLENTWYDRADGLPLESSWTTDVTTPTAIGDSTLASSAHFRLTSLTPHG